MHAIIRQGNGKYYISTVFGYYNDVKSEDDYQRYLERIHSPYYVVWDEAHTKLVKCFAMQPNTKYLIPLVLIIDSDQSRWVTDDNGIGGLDFLPRDFADSVIESGVLPDDILQKCLNADAGYVYEPYKEILSGKDIQDLQWASGYFHDARIAEEKLQEDGKLYLLFDGTWGCRIEVWFWGDLEYETASRDPEKWDPYWLGSSIIRQDGFIYFVDDDEMTVDKITKDYCYFKARHMEYHIIPD